MDRYQGDTDDRFDASLATRIKLEAQEEVWEE
jgi:hypothetical protein